MLSPLRSEAGGSGSVMRNGTVAPLGELLRRQRRQRRGKAADVDTEVNVAIVVDTQRLSGRCAFPRSDTTGSR
jgi:hypothetical protein